IGFMMDCDTSGVEPALGLVAYKSLAGGGSLKLVNATVPRALSSLGYEPHEVNRVLAHVEKYDTIEDVDRNGVAARSGLKPEHLPVFDCAFPSKDGGRSIHWRGHLKM